MGEQGEVHALRQLVGALERENEAKIAERETLYREIEALQEELARLDKYYDINRELERRLREAEEALAHGHGTSEASEIIIREKEEAIAEREAVLQGKNGVILELESMLHEKERIIEEQNAEISHLGSVVKQDAQVPLLQKQQTIKGLEFEVRELSLKNEELEGKCSAHQEQVHRLQTQLVEHQSDIQIISLELERIKSSPVIPARSSREVELESECDSLRRRIEQLEQIVAQQEQDIGAMEEQLQAADEKEMHLIEEIGDLSVKLSNLDQQYQRMEAETVRAKAATPAQHVEYQLQALASNYQKVEHDLLDAQQRLEQTEDYATQLEEQCRAFSQQIQERDQYAQQLQQKIAQLSSSLRNIKGDVPGVSKMDLIRSNNQMIQKINELETKARNPFVKRSFQGSQQVYDSSSAPRAPSGLKKRLQSLKSENQALLKNFQ